MAIPLFPLLLFLIILGDKLFFYLSKINFLEGNGFPPSALIGTVAIEDLSLFGILTLALALASVWRVTRYAIYPLAGAMILFYFADTKLFEALFERLTIAKSYEFIRDGAAIGSFVTSGQIWMLIALLAAFAITRKRYLRPRGGSALVAVSVMSGLIVAPYADLSGRPYDPFFEQFTASFLKINLKTPLDARSPQEAITRIYLDDPEFARKFIRHYQGEVIPACASANDYDKAKEVVHRPNIIILISESLSQVDSARSGGSYDRLTKIDNRVLAEGITFTNFVANGTGTADALAALLLGIEPLPTTLVQNDLLQRFPPRCEEFTSLGANQDHQGSCERNLICLSKRNGYRTIFLTNAPFTFGKTKSWLEGLGFDQMEDDASESLKHLPRYTFGSPADTALYARALEVAAANQEPFLMVLLTVSLHTPYQLPDPKYQIFGDAKLNLLNYVDDTTADFYDGLKKTDFLNKGVFLLVGDHRRMTPFEPEEIAEKGVDASGRVVAGLIGAGIDPGHYERAPFNHTDLTTILGEMVQGVSLSASDLSCYQKGLLLGLDDYFTTSLMSKGYLRLLARTQHEHFIVPLGRQLDPEDFADEVQRKIVSYVALSSDWLARRRSQCGSDPGDAGRSEIISAQIPSR